MEAIVVGTAKLIIVLLVLILLAKISDKHVLGGPFFTHQTWTLNDAYKILIPILALTYSGFLLHWLLPQHASTLSLFFVSIHCAAIYGFYYLFIVKQYDVHANAFGLERQKFLKSGVLHSNIALVFLLLGIIGHEMPAASYATIASIDGNAKLELSIGLITLLIAIFAGPVAEELLFRGILYKPVAGKIGQWKAVALLSLVGAISHLHYPVSATFANVAISSLFYWAYTRSTSLYVSIIWHITLNFIVNRSKLALVLAPFIRSDTLYAFLVCGLLFGLLIINCFWGIETMRKKRLLEELADSTTQQ